MSNDILDNGGVTLVTPPSVFIPTKGSTIAIIGNGHQNEDWHRTVLRKIIDDVPSSTFTIYTHDVFNVEDLSWIVMVSKCADHIILHIGESDPILIALAGVLASNSKTYISHNDLPISVISILNSASVNEIEDSPYLQINKLITKLSSA